MPPKSMVKAKPSLKNYKGQMKVKGKRTKKEKDPNKPKRAMVAFMFFSTEQRQNVQKENPGMGLGEVSKLLGAKWRNLSEKDKAPYEKKAAEDKVRYEKAMKEYKATQPQA